MGDPLEMTWVLGGAVPSLYKCECRHEASLKDTRHAQARYALCAVIACARNQNSVHNFLVMMSLVFLGTPLLYTSTLHVMSSCPE